MVLQVSFAQCGGGTAQTAVLFASHSQDTVQLNTYSYTQTISISIYIHPEEYILIYAHM